MSKSDEDRARVERAVRLIDANLDRPLTLAEVARAAHLSEFHFHRIFAAIIGEPVGRFVTRRRLERAALRLAYEPARSVGEIGLSVGYSSISNFSKAFSAHFGCAPSAVRRAKGLPAALGALTRGRALDPDALYTLPPDVDPRERKARYDALARTVRFEDRGAIELACLASPEGYDLAALERTWDELITRARQLDICGEEVDPFGLGHDSPYLTAPERCRYHACVPCPPSVALPPPLFRGRIPEGRYAIFRFAGEVAGIEETYRAIYSVWLPGSSLAPDDFVAIDHYVNDWPVDGRVDMEILIKVRPRD